MRGGRLTPTVSGMAFVEVPKPASTGSHYLKRDPIVSAPNAVTIIRTVAAVPLGLAALLERSWILLLSAYLTYWIGDVLDGWLARRLHQETRVGAVLDIMSDRACSAVLVCALAVLQPQLWPALAIFLIQFMVADGALSLAFLRWPLLSPNYFYQVDALVWRWNWSPPAKALNTGGVVIAGAFGSLWLAGLIAAAQLGLKIFSIRRVLCLRGAARR